MTWVKISTTSFSGSSAVNVDNVFSATYTHYLVVRNLLGSSANVAIQGRLRVGGTDNTSAEYREQYVTASSTTVAGGRDTGLTFWLQFLGNTEATAYGFSMTRVSNPFEAVRTTAWTDRGYAHPGSIDLGRFVYANDAATSYTGFTAYPASGTITGSITVYGLKAS